MSMPNFQRMNFGMPMIVGRTYDQMARKYEQEFGEGYDEDQFFLDEQQMAEDAVELAMEFSNKLTFHTVIVEPGHYTGFQFVVNEKYGNQFDLDKASDYCIDNDDAHYFFDMCRSEAIRRADAEKRKIKRWLNGLLVFGYNRISCIDVFSSGEAVYAFC